MCRSMILADKIMELRKKNGWSQEELAEILNVSRQSISKWESAQSMPTMDKIVQMSEVFGVSTDFLLKDEIEMEQPQVVDDNKVFGNVKKVSIEEANKYLQICEAAAGKKAIGTAMCILSPVMLIFMAGLQESGLVSITENAAVAIGMACLFLLIAGAVALFIITESKTNAYEYIEKEVIETEYGVSGMVKTKKEQYKDVHVKHNVLGTVLCVLAAVPIIMTALFTENEFYVTASVCVTLLLVDIGVFDFVLTSVVWGSYQALLEEGEYTKGKKAILPKKERVMSIYWIVITAIYLAWSFTTFEWHRTWIIWPVAGVLSGFVSEIVELATKKQ